MCVNCVFIRATFSYALYLTTSEVKVESVVTEVIGMSYMLGGKTAPSDRQNFYNLKRLLVVYTQGYLLLQLASVASSVYQVAAVANCQLTRQWGCHGTCQKFNRSEFASDLRSASFNSKGAKIGFSAWLCFFLL